jgi:hypothetical protein
VLVYGLYLTAFDHYLSSRRSVNGTDSRDERHRFVSAAAHSIEYLPDITMGGIFAGPPEHFRVDGLR